MPAAFLGSIFLHYSSIVIGIVIKRNPFSDQDSPVAERSGMDIWASRFWPGKDKINHELAAQRGLRWAAVLQGARYILIG